MINLAPWNGSSNNGSTREKVLCCSYVPSCDGINKTWNQRGPENMSNNKISANEWLNGFIYFEGVNWVLLYIGKLGQSIPLLRCFRFDLLKPLNPRHSLLSRV